MKTMQEFLKNTIVGGLLFLLPLGLVVLVLKQVMSIATAFATPIVARLPVRDFAGVTMVTLVAVLLLLLVALLSGMLARTRFGRRVSSWVEESILGGIPQYRMVKSMAEGLTNIEAGAGMRPVLMRGDEGWQLAYRLEELPGGWVAVFVPAAPTPMSGNVMYVAQRRVQELPIGMPEAMKLVKSVGVGSTQALRGVDLGSAQEG